MLPVRIQSANSEFTGNVLWAVPADTKDYFAVGAVRLFLKIAVIAIRFIGVLAHYLKTVRSFISSGFFPELFHARIAQGIETGFAFFL